MPAPKHKRAVPHDSTPTARCHRPNVECTDTSAKWDACALHNPVQYADMFARRATDSLGPSVPPIPTRWTREEQYHSSMAVGR